MKFVFSTLFLFGCLSMIGQKHFVSLHGGAGLSNITGINSVISTKDRLGMQTGLSYRYRVSELFSVNTGAIYSQKGYRTLLQITDEQGNFTGAPQYFGFHMNYLSVPIQGSLHLGQTVQGIVRAGLVTSFLLNAARKVPESLAAIDPGSTGFEETIAPVDFSFLAEFGGKVRLAESFDLLTMLGFQHSITEYQKSDVASSFVSKHYNLQLTLGLEYSL